MLAKIVQGVSLATIISLMILFLQILIERWVGKQHTKAIEGNNCAIRHRISRAVRKSCCFSKSLFYHIKVFNIGFAYINACHWRKHQKNRRGCPR